MSQVKQSAVTKQANKAEARQPAQVQQGPDVLSVWEQPQVVMRRAVTHPRFLTQCDSAYLQRTVGNQALKGIPKLLGNVSLAQRQQHNFRLNSVSIQRQEHNRTRQAIIPAELLRPVDITSLPDRQLQDRYDRISRILNQLDEASSHKRQLQQEAGRIGTELARRSALAAGRTFSPEAIERMRNYFITNASSTKPVSCIAALNTGVRTLLNRSTQRVGSDIQTTMTRLQAAGRAGRSQVTEFADANNRLTRGVRRPHRLMTSIWDTVIAMTGGDPGWSVFGLSLMDGYHSVTLSLDNRNPSRPRIFWSDQWPGGGWQEFTRATLDEEVTRRIQVWWDNELQGKQRRLRTRVTLWRLNQ